MKCLRSLEHWDHRFKSYLGRGYLVCLCVYYVFVVSCAKVVALRLADHSSKESYSL
jgi:hypothetical protein